MVRKKLEEQFYQIMRLLEHKLMPNTPIIKARLEIKKEELFEKLNKYESVMKVFVVLTINGRKEYALFTYKENYTKKSK